MTRTARLPLTFALGLVPLLGYGDSRNMAAQIDSDECRGERTLYRSSGGARPPTQPVAPLPGVEFEFTRLVYAENPSFARGWGGWGGGRRWRTDAPEAETHLFEELPVSNEVFHVLYDLVERPQIPSVYGAMSGSARGSRTAIVHTGPHWRGIHDEDGRLTVAIDFNMDLGDAWEHADNPALHYLLYSMSH